MLDNRVLDRMHVRRGKRPEPAFQTFLVCRHDLIGHRFGLSAIDTHKCLAWIDLPDITGQGHYDEAGQIAIGCVVAEDDSRSRLADFATDSGVKFDPPDFTALYR